MVDRKNGSVWRTALVFGQTGCYNQTGDTSSNDNVVVLLDSSAKSWCNEDAEKLNGYRQTREYSHCCVRIRRVSARVVGMR